MTIFKAYDVRGKYPEEINEKMAYKIGRAFVVLTKTKEVMVGMDARTHSPALAKALIHGITDQGASVTNIGLATTPQTIAMHIWAGHECAIMVTASHLDAPFNGFKLYSQKGNNINVNHGMRELEELVEQEKFPHVSHKGSVKNADYTSKYVARISEIVKPDNAPVFVADCSNGSVGPELKLLVNKLGLPVTIINEKPDGNFPSHSPNPLAQDATKQAAQKVRELGAKGGCVFDADADRIFFLDENGQTIHPNYISCLIAERLLEMRPGATIAYDLISTRRLPELVSQLGGTALRTRVGRNVLVDDMRQAHAIFAAESSSHMIYEEAAYADASTLSLLYILDILGDSGVPFSELVKKYATYALISETNFHIEDKDGAIADIEHAFAGASIDHLDGVTVTFSQGWINARKSNTEPVLRIRAEGNTKEFADKLLEQVARIIAARGGVPVASDH